MPLLLDGKTPAELGFYMPAEWGHHQATWLSWPHKEESWPGKIMSIYPYYCQFIGAVAKGEEVHINVKDADMAAFALEHLSLANIPLTNIKFHHNETNDAWCRDHGPAFLLNHDPAKGRMVVDWGYNAWGGKYPPFDLDDDIPTKIAAFRNVPVVHPGIVMEGGSVEFNGKGTLLTSKACLLNENRNPELNQEQIETYLRNYYGVEQILWLGDGIEGDDTDGHIDDLTRFVNEDTVVTVVETDKSSANYEVLQDNLRDLKKMRLLNGKQLNVIELPMPKPVIYDEQVLPASYANYYVANAAIVVPTYQDDVNDQRALDILTALHPDRKVIGIDSTELIWGLGSFHCLSQQEAHYSPK
jgi:agmatine deiminase